MMRRHNVSWMDSLWKDYFKDPSPWLYTDTIMNLPRFTHIRTNESLWIDGLYNPYWVYEELTRNKGFVVSINGDHMEPNCGEEELLVEEIGNASVNKVSFAFVALLKDCGNRKNLDELIRLHVDIVRSGLLENNTYLATTLVSMYVKCGDLAKAQGVLEEIPFQDVISYNSLIGGYAQQGKYNDAFDSMDQMRNKGLSPDKVTFICILKACGKMGNLDKGKEIHEEIVCRGFLHEDITLGTALVDMYAKCGELAEAHLILKAFPMRNVVSWNALIAGYSEYGQCHKALACIELMQRDGLSPNVVTFVCIVKACGSQRDMDKGKEIHDDIVSRRLLEKDIVLGNALVDMYAKCGALAKAQEVLKELSTRDIVSWNALIAGYAQRGQVHEVLDCFKQIQSECLSPNAITFTCILKACCIARDIEKGKQIHEEILNRGLLEKDILLGNALVDMYAKCGFLAKAQQVLDGLLVRNIVSWSTLIAGYTHQGQGHNALDCFERMQSEGFSPDLVTYIYAFKACGIVGSIDKGKQIHDTVVCRGLIQKDNVLGNALVDMYAKCGTLLEAQKVLKELPVRDVVSWNSLIAGYAQCGRFHAALNTLEEMQCDGISPDAVTFICCLRACASLQTIDKGKQIHEKIESENLLDKDIVLGAALVDMYAKCGMLVKATQVLEDLLVRDVSSWNALVAGYVQHGQIYKALIWFEMMECEGVCPNAVTFICALGACGIRRDVEKGKQIHAEVVSRGFLVKNIALGNALLDMYAKCGTFGEARMVMEELPVQDKVSWNALVAGHAHMGQGHEALNCFERMQKEGFAPDAISFICALKACANMGSIDKGTQIHDEIISTGLLGKDIMLGNALVDMYTKCGVLTKALQVLEELPIRNTISWNVLIAGYAERDQGLEALSCYKQMQSEGLSPDEVTLLFVLKACASAGDIIKGKQIHDEIASRGLFEKDIVLGNVLVDMYAKCGALVEAQMVFNELPNRSIVSWNAVISSYSQRGRSREALNCFSQMQSEGLSPDIVTFIFILKACGDMGAMDKGKKIHEEIGKRGLIEKDIALGNALVDMYAKCGMLKKAHEVLDELPHRDIVSWNALIVGYIQDGQAQQALNYFEWMQTEGLTPDSVSFICALKACGSTGALNKGKQIHDDIVSRGFLKKDSLLGVALVDMYAKCGLLDKARKVLKELPIQSIVSWNVLIGEYAQQGQSHEALNCFEYMLSEDICIDVTTFICMLKACGSVGAISKGKQIHDEVVRRGLLQNDIMLATALIDMYCKCGMLEKAHVLLKELHVRDEVSWSALIAGYAQQGQGYQALNCLKEMKTEGFSPDEITFLSLLSACSHSGLLEEAQMLFEDMTRRYGITPSLEHLTCILVVFGYAGQFNEAISMIRAMPSSGCPEVWLALLGACKKWGNVKVGSFAFGQALLLDNACAAAYVLMASIFASSGMQEDAERVEAMRMKYACCVNQHVGNSVESL